MNQPAHSSSVEVGPARFTAAEFAAMAASGALADMTVEFGDPLAVPGTDAAILL